ncbi:MAG: hypothetical protein ACE14Q_04060 [Acidobacteriota bacterium]
MALKPSALIELHLHLEGSIYPSDAIYLCQKDKIPFNNNMYRHSNFEIFLKHFGDAVSLLKDKEDLVFILQNHLKRLKRWGVVYAEIRVSPSVWERFGLNAEESAKYLFSSNLDPIIKHNFIVESVRHWDKESIERDFNIAIKYKNKVKAFGIGGNEILAPIEDFKFLFEECSQNGIVFIPHCGEVSSADEVLKAIEYGAKRIGHGIKSSQSEIVMNKLKENDVHLEICPTSNLLTGAVKRNSPHPLKTFYDYSVKISVSTDDPGLFLTTMKKELFFAEKMLENQSEALLKIQKDALKASLLTPKEKEFILTKYYL